MFNKNSACAIMQPTYLPWLGYFDLIARVQEFIFLDNVKFNKSSYHHQNKILSTNGVILLSVPTHARKGRMETSINEVEIDNSKNWKKKHLSSIRQSYGKARYYSEIYPCIEDVISKDIRSLSELNIELIKLFSSILALDVNFHLASHLDIPTNDKTQRLIDLCRMYQCDSYYSPVGALDYLDTIENKKRFKAADIEVYFQDFETVPYPQIGKEFVSYMSVLDALMFRGPEKTKGIITQGSHITKFNQ